MVRDYNLWCVGTDYTLVCKVWKGVCKEKGIMLLGDAARAAGSGELKIALW